MERYVMCDQCGSLLEFGENNTKDIKIDVNTWKKVTKCFNCGKQICVGYWRKDVNFR